MNIFETSLEGKMFKSANKYKVFVADDTFWVAYAPGSGIVMPRFKTKSFITSKRDDSHYDDVIHNLLKFVSNTPPDAKKGDSKLYKIPMYRDHDVDVFNKDPKPYAYSYMVANTSGVPVVNFFKTKGEATTWMKSEG